MVEQRLFLAGDCHDGCPWIGGKRRCAPGAVGADDRLEQQMLRHWQRAFRLAIGHGHEAQVEGRFLLLFRCAGFCLEQAAGDPLGHKGDLGVGELVLFVRHERLLLMGDKLIKEAAIRVAGLDRTAAAAALEHVRVARQVEAALGLVGVVAGVTCALKKRANMILIRDFLLRLGKWRIAEPSGDREQDGVFKMHG